MRIIPKKTKVSTEFFKGLSLSDVIVGFIGLLIITFVLVSNLPYKVYIITGFGVLFLFLLLRLDEEPMYRFLLDIFRYLCYRKNYKKLTPEEREEAAQLMQFTPKERRELKREERKNAKKLAAEAKKQQKKAIKEEERMADSPSGNEEGKKQGASHRKKDRSERKKEKSGQKKEAHGKKSRRSRKNEQEDARKPVRGITEHETAKPGRSRKSRRVSRREDKKERERLEKERQQTPEAIAAREEARNLRFQQQLIRKEEKKQRDDIAEMMPFTNISDQVIHYGGSYYGAVIELPAVEFRFFSEHRQDHAIDDALGGVLRNLPSKYSANLVKIERPMIYDEYISEEYKKIDSLNAAYINGLFTEEELMRRVEIAYDRIYYLNSICYDNKVILPFFYLVLFDSDMGQLNALVNTAVSMLQTGEMNPRRLDDREIAVFLKYTNGIDFDEREISKVEPEDYIYFAMPDLIDIRNRTVEVNGIMTHNMRVVSYPTAIGNAWGAYPFDTAGTKVVMKMKPIDRIKAIRAIDRSIDELRSQENATGKSSKLIELSTHIDTLSELLVMLQNDNESLLEVNIYVTAYDIAGTMTNRKILHKPEHSVIPMVSNIKKTVRRIYSESGLKLKDMQFGQMEAFIGSQVSGYDPLESIGRDIHSSSVAAVFPFIYSYLNDKGGVNLGKNNGVPVFIDFFRRDNDRVNSNMVIIGKSGSGKSFATKSLLSNLAAENGKIFVLDPENEYTDMAHNLGGKIINVGNASQGRLNPFHIITNLEDDEEEEGGEGEASTSFSTHLQFLEEFFRQILPEIESDAMEYLNNLIIRVYSLKGIDEYTELAELQPEDYPTFDDLYDVILEEFQSTRSAYLRSNLQILMNYVAKFSTGGRNAALWNGYSTISTEENFIVFNFQSLLANRNNTVANAQMLLVLKWLDNEIIKNRDYNIKYHENRKIIVIIDEAHVFIDTKYPLALDFMFQLAKRIRKYNGMQIVITQNIKDFVGSEEIARKSTAIINACQYSLIFSLAPNDMHDLCKLYEKAGEINEREQEQIINAKRGQAFVITSPTSRSALTVDTPDGIRHMFSDRQFQSAYFKGTDGEEEWEKIAAPLRRKKNERMAAAFRDEAEGRTDRRVFQGGQKRTASVVEIVELEDGNAVSADAGEAVPLEEPPRRESEAVLRQEMEDAPLRKGAEALKWEEEEPRRQESAGLTSENIEELLARLRRQVKEEILSELEEERRINSVKAEEPKVEEEPAPELEKAPETEPVPGLMPAPASETEPVPEPRPVPKSQSPWETFELDFAPEGNSRASEADQSEESVDYDEDDLADLFNILQAQSERVMELKKSEEALEEESESEADKKKSQNREPVYEITLEELMVMED